MARKPRLNLPGIPLHVVQRGNNRDACFFSAHDYTRYLEDLTLAARKTGCALHAYVLMTNHAHLLLTPHESNSASLMMQSLGRRYVRYINDTYQRTGTLWEGRFKASLVDTETYFLACMRYIELNPVRAAIVADPADYRWSSYHANAGDKVEPRVIAHECFLRLGSDDESRRLQYRRLVEQAISLDEIKAIRESTRFELPLGSERFKQQIEVMVGRRVGVGRKGRPPKLTDAGR